MEKSIPSKTLTLESGKELTMSYGMFNDLMRFIGNNEDAVELLLNDASTRDLALRRLMTDSKKPVENVEELINPFDMDIDVMEMGTVIAWIADHVMHFTMSTAQKAKVVVEQYQAAAVSLSQSKSGSEV